MIHILLVEDEEAHAELVRRAFQRAPQPERFHLTVINNLKNARNFLTGFQPDLVIADWLLPDGQGVELLPAGDEARATRRFPVVMMTSHGDEQMAVEAMKAGALDYVVKSATTLADIPRVAERALREWRHIVERRKAEQALQRKTHQQEQLIKTARHLTASLDVKEVLTRIGVGAREILKASGCVTYLLQDDGKTLAPVVAIDPSHEQEQLSTPLDVESSFTGQAIKARKSLIFNDAGSDPFSQGPGSSTEEGKHIIVAPFIADDKVLGAMCLNHNKRLFVEEDLTMAEIFATYAATALKNAQTHRDLQHEVEERKRAERERARLLVQVQEQAQRMQQIMDTVPEGVLLLDRNDQIVLTNPIAEENLSVLSEVQVGDVLTHLGNYPLTELLSPPSKELWHEITTDSPSPQVFEVIARPVKETTETSPVPGGWVLVIRDVTKERETERRIQQQERLAAVGQLAAGIAHDFNNIMASIVLYAQMTARMEELPDRVRQRMVTINQQAVHATKLIQQILDFSRRAIIERHPLDLAPFLREQIQLLRRTLPENIEIKMTHKPDEVDSMLIVNADLTRMQQAIMNLALNARDAMPEGGELHIGLERIRIAAGEAAPLPEMETAGTAIGEWIQITVRDTGMGIPPDVLPHIFEPFFTTRAPLGSGLGLAQVHGIVRQHEGYIDVKTQLVAEHGQPRGTTFTIYLPTLKTHIPESLTIALDQAQTPLPKKTLALPKGQGETILVVEDDTKTRRVLAESLELINYQVIEAGNGREALTILEQLGDTPSASSASDRGISLILSDMVMPGMGGIALLHALEERKARVQVVLLTGHPLKHELESLEEQQIAAWLAGWMLKPPDLEQLAKVIDRALKKDTGT
jgi:signal transduction histidine kinase/DNA-binding response OmpR family regulator